MGTRRPGEGVEVDAEVQVSRIAPEQFTTSSLASPAADLLRKLVADGAALGWVDPPPFHEIERLLHDVVTKSRHGDGCLVAAYRAKDLVGLGYWRRYDRATHRPHADVEKIGVRPGHPSAARRRREDRGTTRLPGARHRKAADDRTGRGCN